MAQKGRPKRTLKEVYKDKVDRLLEGVAYWGAYYRENPQIFAKDYLHIELKPFQKMLLYEFMHNNYNMYIAARSQGKTYLFALYCVIRCILYPGTKIVVCSGIKKQAIEVIQKIEDDFLKLHEWGSANLRMEITHISSSDNKAECLFKNGSFIRVVTANDNARGNRANVILADEFRQIDKSILDTVIRKFNGTERHPGYLDKPEYKNYPKDRNIELYASSAYYTSHWAYTKAYDYFKKTFNDKVNYFFVGLPYQVSVEAGLRSIEQIQDEMMESDFDELAFRMELCTEWLGSTGDDFFVYDDISKRRRIKKAFYPLEIYKMHHIAIPDLVYGEKRVLSVDVALMSSKKNNNDSSALWINSAIPTENNDLISNFVYAESYEGLTTDELGLIVMRMFYQYKCTDLVLDTNGQGLGIYDFIIKPQYDPDYGVTYDAMTCINDNVMADRCKVKGANRVIWSIKATAEFNSNAALRLRSGLQNGNINLLKKPMDVEDELKKIRGYKQFTERQQSLLKLPYIQTDFLVNELINLEHETKGVNVRVYERSGMRKDRYSSIMMNYKITQDLAVKQKPQDYGDNIIDLLPIVTSKRIRAT